ncbi:MAG TPA: hypothetical protein VM513_20750 [Kofleriaceae bacterium]|nr:hypothetical protein [Kofleriaceae bacterium]
MLAGVLIGVLVGAAAAQPAPEADRERAKLLYGLAELDVQAGRFDDAIRNYTGAYDLTHDPVLFYKIGSASERAGKCDVALIYYGRYLQEAKGTDAFVEQTRERIRACGGDDRNLARPARPAGPTDAPGNTMTAPGNAAPSSTAPPATSAPEVTPAASTTATPAPTVAATPAAAPAAPAPTTGLRPRNRAAWLLVASSVAFATVGGVLAYSASSAENDIRDLYVGLNDLPPSFDARTKATYDALVEEGERYDTLAWVSFGLAGASAIAAGVLFWRGSEEQVQIAPTASATGAGVTLGGRF